MSYPVGEYPDITPMVRVAAGDLRELHERIEKLEREKYHLQLLVDQARGERDAAYVQAHAHRMAP